MTYRARIASLATLVLLLAPFHVPAYEEIEVQDGGTIKGRVTYSGSVPTKTIVPDDPEVCGGPRKDPQIHVSSDGGVQDALVYIDDVDKGKPWSDAKPAESARLDNRDCAFAPQMLAMPPGDVTVVNSDPILHNTHIFQGRRTTLNLALPKKGLEIERELKRPGILRIECDEHGHMHAAGYVAANPYYSATNESGQYEISDVPPGEYTLQIYQRTTGPKEEKVTVEPGATVTLDIDLAK
jgi:plastocyanin